MSVIDPAESGSGWYGAYEAFSPSEQSGSWVGHGKPHWLRCPPVSLRKTSDLDVCGLLRATGERQCHALLDDHVLHVQSSSSSAQEPPTTSSDTSSSGHVAVQLNLLMVRPPRITRRTAGTPSDELPPPQPQQVYLCFCSFDLA